MLSLPIPPIRIASWCRTCFPKEHTACWTTRYYDATLGSMTTRRMTSPFIPASLFSAHLPETMINWTHSSPVPIIRVRTSEGALKAILGLSQC